MQLPVNMEIWRLVDDFPTYQISSHGRVMNKLGKILTAESENKYYRVKLYLNRNKSKKYLVHRLVALAFIPNPSNKPCIDHIDKNRINNSVDNLRWCTHQENNKNRSKQKNNKSGYTGVLLEGSTRRWRTTITDNEGNLIRKSFISKEDAIKYRKEKEIEFGYTND